MINKSPQTPVASDEAGFSLIEVLIAAAVLLIVTIGILPMFTRAIANNVQGQQLTQAVHKANSEMEAMIQSEFNGTDLTIPAGETELETVEFWSQDDGEWLPAASIPAEERTYRRTTTIRQFNLNELKSSPDTGEWTALTGDVAANQVHLKEIEVEVTTADSGTSSILGPPRTLVLRTYKSF